MAALAPGAPNGPVKGPARSMSVVGGSGPLVDVARPSSPKATARAQIGKPPCHDAGRQVET
jgi:hypothetical protein